MDVTAVKQMRQRLEGSEQRYRRLTDAVTDYIYTYHVRVQRGRAVQTVHGANCEALTGHAPEEFDANPMLWIAMVPTEDRVAVELQAARILSGKDAPNLEHRIQRKDGQIRWVLSTVSPQHDDQGRLIAYDGLLCDLTERKPAKEAFRQLNETLEQRVADQTREMKMQAKEAHRSNQQLLQTIYDTEPECVKLMNADGTLTMMNRAGLKMIEADSVDEVQGESVFSLVVPEDRDAFQSLTQSVFRGESGTLEFDIVGRRGTHRTLETHAVPLRDSSGDITSLLAITRDITERKRAEQALQESEKRYRSLVTASAATVWTTDPDGGFSSPQPSWEVHTGQPWEEHRGWGWSKMIHPDDIERIGRAWREAIDESRSYYIEGRVWRAASGEYHYFEVRAVPIFNDDGTVREWIGTTTDIHDRKLAEESLRREHELSESMIDTAQNIVLVLDTDGRIVRFNAYMEELSGWQIDEVRGRDWYDTFVPEHDRQPLRKLFARALGGERTRGDVTPIVTKSGHEREIEWYDASLTDANGELVGLLCTGQDVTERRILQREILEIAADEQRRIGQELHDSTQQQLTGLGLLAKTVATALDKLCQADEDSRLSREAGFLDRIAGMQQRATQVQNGLEHAACEVNQLSRGLIPVELDGQGLMSSLTELARSVNEVQQIACTFTSDASIEMANNFTATHLYRIAQEAVNNALKHSRGKRIEISLSERNGVITLKVFDNGNGIDKKRGNGPGMGLRIMSYRAELIGAVLSIGPANGGGTEMTCTVTQS